MGYSILCVRGCHGYLGRAHGPGFYSSLDANETKAKNIFEFCKEMGVVTIVAEPPDNAFDMIEKDSRIEL